MGGCGGTPGGGGRRRAGMRRTRRRDGGRRPGSQAGRGAHDRDSPRERPRGGQPSHRCGDRDRDGRDAQCADRAGGEYGDRHRGRLGHALRDRPGTAHRDAGRRAARCLRADGGDSARRAAGAGGPVGAGAGAAPGGIIGHERRCEVRRRGAADRRLDGLPDGLRREANGAVLPHADRVVAKDRGRSVVLQRGHEGRRARRSRLRHQGRRHADAELPGQRRQCALSRRVPWTPPRHVHRFGRSGGRGPLAAGRRDPRDQRARQVRVALRSGAQGLDDGPRQPGAVARPARGGVGRAGRLRRWSPGPARPRRQRAAGGVCDVRRVARRRVSARVGAVPARLQRRVRRRLHQPQPPHLLYVVGAVRGPEGEPAVLGPRAVGVRLARAGAHAAPPSRAPPDGGRRRRAGGELLHLGDAVRPANPFQRLPYTPLDGSGLNPQLQNPGMVFHPPMLYLGYISITIPFAFAIAALLSKRVDADWLVAIRKWTLLSWLFLSIGICLGMWWAYVELGWGGYWAWDPVENASLLPWLTMTAFLHSVMVQEKRGMLKKWNLALIIGSWLLSIFGTFITRSGVISSVHSFTQSSVGYFFLAFLIVAAAASFTLYATRLPLLTAETQLESMVSREASFLFNNLLLIGIALSVLR